MRLIKTLIFHLLLALRGFVLAASKLCSFLCITGAILAFFVNDFHSVPLAAKIMTLTLAIIFTLVNWLYDYLIFYIAPENIEVTLYH